MSPSEDVGDSIVTLWLPAQTLKSLGRQIVVKRPKSSTLTVGKGEKNSNIEIENAALLFY